MEHKLILWFEASLYCLVFLCFLIQLVHNIIVGAVSEGIVFIAGLTTIAGSLAYGAVTEVVKKKN